MNQHTRSILLGVALLLLPLLSSCSVDDPLRERVYFTEIRYEGWEELVVPASAMAVLPLEGPGEGNCQAGFVYLFADEALVINEDYVHFNVQLPHSYKEGTDIYFVPHFLFNSDQVGTNIRWKISHSWANRHTAFPSSSHLWILSDSANNDSLVHQTAQSGAVSGSGKTIGSELLCYISRNSSDVLDTYTDTALLTAVSVLFQIDSPGSTSMWVK